MKKTSIDLSNITVTFRMDAKTNGIHESVIRQWIVAQARETGLSLTQVIKKMIAEKIENGNTTSHNDRTEQLYPLEAGTETGQN